MTTPAWEPTDEQLGEADLTAFQEALETDWDIAFDEPAELWRWSVEAMDCFWLTFKDHAELLADTWGETVVEPSESPPGARWFPEASFSLARNLLPRRDEALALVIVNEAGVHRWSWERLAAEVSRVRQALRADGLRSGDRLLLGLPACPEAVALFIAAAAEGLTVAHLPPGSPVEAARGPLAQLRPSCAVTVAGGLDRSLAALLPGLPRVSLALGLVEGPPGLRAYAGWIAPFGPIELEAEGRPFDHPLLVSFVAEASGAGLGVVHGAGGLFLHHRKEQRLEVDLRPGDRLLAVSRPEAAPWVWLVHALGGGHGLILIDPSVTTEAGPGRESALALAATEAYSHLCGDGAALRLLGPASLGGGSLSGGSLRAWVCLAGPLSEADRSALEGLDLRGRRVIELCSDPLARCVVAGGHPWAAARWGELSTPALGMGMELWTGEGEAAEGEGLVVILTPFPGMPVALLDDPGGLRFQAAGFGRWPEVWSSGLRLVRAASGGFTTCEPGSVTAL
jgi:acetoacetyl-CoA synthetase